MTMVKKTASRRSRTPPWGPKRAPVSFLPRSRFTIDSKRSPSGAIAATAAPRSSVDPGEPILVQAGEPDAHRADHEATYHPSSVLLGERLGAIRWLPNMRPVA